MSTDMSFFHLIAGASFVVQLVMLLLLVVSMVSWTMIFDRARVLKKARRAAEADRADRAGKRKKIPTRVRRMRKTSSRIRSRPPWPAPSIK